MIRGVNIIGRKTNLASANRDRGSGDRLYLPKRVFSRLLEKCLGTKENPNRHRIDLNAAKIITFQNYKRTKRLM